MGSPRRRTAVRAAVGATFVLVAVVMVSSSYAAVPGLELRAGSITRALVSSSLGWTLGPGGNFSTYLGSAQRNDNASQGGGILNLTNAASLQPLWEFATGSQIASQPIVVDGVVYVGSWDGYEYALYATNGTLLWKTFLGLASGDVGCGSGSPGLTSTASYSGGDLYVNGGTPDLFVLNASTGKPLWNVTLGGPTSEGYYLWSSPLVAGGYVYDGISSQCDEPLVPAGLAQISLETHLEVNYFNSSVPYTNGSSIWASPSMNGASHTVYVTTGNPYEKLVSTYGESVVALNSSTLRVKHSWTVPKSEVVGDGDFGSTPVLFTPTGGPAMVAAIDKNGYLYAWYQSNLTLMWKDKISTATGVVANLAFAHDRIYVSSPHAVIDGVAYNSSVMEINPLNGAYLWQVGLKNTFVGYAAPLWFDDVLIVTANTKLLVMSAGSGKTLATIPSPLDGRIFAPASMSRSEVFFGAGKELVALDLPLSVGASASAAGPADTEKFTSTVQGGLPPYSYNWSFGDSSYSSSASPSHTYSGPGTYDVTVTVTDLAHSTASAKLTVIVSSQGGSPATTLQRSIPWVALLKGSESPKSETLVLMARAE